jgi:hypothetical protein
MNHHWNHSEIFPLRYNRLQIGPVTHLFMLNFIDIEKIHFEVQTKIWRKLTGVSRVLNTD